MIRPVTELLRVGVVAGSHGLRGELKLRSEDPDFSVLHDHDELFLQQAGATPLCCRIRHRAFVRGNLLVKLDGFDEVAEAESFKGAAVLIDPARLPELPSGGYYWHQLRGLRAVDRKEGDLGVLTGLFTTAAHDIYVVMGPFGEVLIPAVDRFVERVDLAAGAVFFDLPEGLVEKSDDL